MYVLIILDLYFFPFVHKSKCNQLTTQHYVNSSYNIWGVCTDSCCVSIVTDRYRVFLGCGKRLLLIAITRIAQVLGIYILSCTKSLLYKNSAIDLVVENN